MKDNLEPSVSYLRGSWYTSLFGGGIDSVTVKSHRAVIAYNYVTIGRWTSFKLTILLHITASVLAHPPIVNVEFS